VRLKISGIREFLNKPYGISRKGFIKMNGVVAGGTV